MFYTTCNPKQANHSSAEVTLVLNWKLLLDQATGAYMWAVWGGNTS